MNQKGFVNIALIILVLVLAGALGYVTLVKKPFSIEPQPISQATPPPAVSDNSVLQNPPPSNLPRIIKSVNTILGSYNVINGKIIQKDGKIEIIDSADKTTSLTIKDSVLFGISTIISPSGKYLFYGWGPGDAIGGFIYDLETNSHYAIGGVSVVSPKYGYKWLTDGRFEFYRGCVLANQCDRYVSKNSEQPWEIEKVN